MLNTKMFMDALEIVHSRYPEDEWLHKCTDKFVINNADNISTATHCSFFSTHQQESTVHFIWWWNKIAIALKFLSSNNNFLHTGCPMWLTSSISANSYFIIPPSMWMCYPVGNEKRLPIPHKFKHTLAKSSVKGSDSYAPKVKCVQRKSMEIQQITSD